MAVSDRGLAGHRTGTTVTGVCTCVGQPSRDM